MGDEYIQVGRLEKAREEFQARVRLSPDDALDAYVNLGILAQVQGDTQKARANWSQALAIWENAWRMRLQTPAGLLENKALALLGQGETEVALKTLQEALENLYPGDIIELNRYMLLAQAPDPPGGLDKMLSLLRQTIVQDPERSLPETDTYNRACLEAIAGNPEIALDHLEKALAQSPGLRPWAAQDPDLASLHDHPRFQALIAAPSDAERPD